MAATVSAWSKPGAWALDSEENEAELLQQTNNDNNKIIADTKPLAEFPSLAVAAATKPKKKKAQTLSLAEFTAKPVYTLTHQDPVDLPTGPRQRTAEELERDRSRIGGGFRSYGDRPNRSPSGDDSSNSRWGSSRVSDESRRNGAFGSRDSRDGPRDGPSRADEIDNWAAAKKPSVGNGFDNRSERRERDRGGFFDSQSRADESDSWVTNKSFAAPSEGRRFGGSGGGGFERERKVGFGTSGGADSDNWNRKKGEVSVGNERSDSVGERPRLVLQPRTGLVNNEIQNQDVVATGNVVKPKGSNPFGEARPREQVLAEKGQDWKKIDEQLESMKIKETTAVEGFGKRSFGSGNGRAANGSERSWRKSPSDDGRSESAEKVEDEKVEDEKVEDEKVDDEKVEDEHVEQN